MRIQNNTKIPSWLWMRCEFWISSERCFDMHALLLHNIIKGDAFTINCGYADRFTSVPLVAWVSERLRYFKVYASQLFGVVLVNKFPSHTTKTNAGYKRALSHEIHAAFSEEFSGPKEGEISAALLLYRSMPLHYFCVYLSSTLCCCCRRSVAKIKQCSCTLNMYSILVSLSFGVRTRV